MHLPCCFAVLSLLLLAFTPGQGQQTDSQYDSDGHHKRSNVKGSRSAPVYDEVETTSEYWRDWAQRTVHEKVNRRKIEQKAKNVIFFIGDGMSPQTLAATRMYLGNENVALSFEQFPHHGAARTYCVDRQVADSACTATAYLSGVKNNYGTINVSPSVTRGTCDYDRSVSDFLGLLKWAQQAGKVTGLVTDTRITHATPAGAYASTAHRDWEDDGVLADACPNTEDKPMDIAAQLVHGEVGKQLKVIMGGGRRHLLPSTVTDDEGSRGARRDGRNLIEEWKQLHADHGKAEYVWNKQGLLGIYPNETDYLLGLFESSHLLYNLEVDEQQLNDREPKLNEMVAKALDMLEGSPTGYVLFVEGGKIDTAHHSTRPRLALEEANELHKTVDLARRRTNEEDTLIVVSADHSHTMTYNGYTTRGNDILGIADISDQDNLPYTTLSYANGAGFSTTYKSDNPADRADVSTYDLHDYRTRYLATVPLSSETHGAEDVGVYASGPYAHLFSGNFEQNVIPHLIAYAAGIGEPIQLPVDNENDDDGGSAATASISALLIGMSVTIALYVRL